MIARPGRNVAVIVAVLSIAATAPPSPAPPATPENESFVEKVKDGSVDWGAGSVAAWGRAVDLDSPRYGEVSGQARWNAETVAKERLLEIAHGLRADSQLRIGDRPDVAERTREIVQAARVIGERKGRGRFYEVLVSVPLNGPEGLTSILHETKEVSGSAGAPGAPGTEAAKEQAPAGAPTGVVIDARGTRLAPALLPRFVDEAREVIAAPGTVNESDLQKRGMAAYAQAFGGDAWLDRVGDRPLTIRAAASSGALEADVVLSKADADRIRSDVETMKRFRECRVVVIVESSAAGPAS